MNPLAKAWFWLLIISIIGFIISFVLFERYGQTNTGSTSTPGWIWVVFIVSFILWIIALVLYIVDVAHYHKQLEIAEACGLLPPPPPKKKIECPKEKCIEKKVIECQRPCDSKTTVTDTIVTPVNTEVVTSPVAALSTDKQIVVPGSTTVDTVTTKVVGVNPNNNFAAAGLQPLSSLAPPPVTQF